MDVTEDLTCRWINGQIHRLYRVGFCLWSQQKCTIHNLHDTSKQLILCTLSSLIWIIYDGRNIEWIIKFWPIQHRSVSFSILDGSKQPFVHQISSIFSATAHICCFLPACLHMVMLPLLTHQSLQWQFSQPTVDICWLLTWVSVSTHHTSSGDVNEEDKTMFSISSLPIHN